MKIQEYNDYITDEYLYHFNHPGLISGRVIEEIRDPKTLANWSQINKSTYKLLLGLRARLICQSILSQQIDWLNLCSIQFDPSTYLSRNRLTKKLVKYWTKSDLVTPDIHSRTFLHAACDAHNLNCINAVIECDKITQEILNSKDRLHRSPLACAFQSKNVELIKALLSHKDVTQETVSEALHYNPSGEANPTIIGQHLSNLQYTGSTIQINCEGGNAEIFNTIFDSKKILKEDLVEFLPHALKNLEVFNALLKLDEITNNDLFLFLLSVPPNTYSPLHYLAGASENSSIFKALLKSDKVTTDTLTQALTPSMHHFPYMTPFEIALDHNNLEFIEACFESDKVSLNFDILKIILDRVPNNPFSGFEKNYQTQVECPSKYWFGIPILPTTLESKRLKQLEFILKSDKLNPEALYTYNSDRMTITHYAFKLKNDGIFKLFLSSDKVNSDTLSIQNSDGWTALHYAASYINLSKRIDLVESLLASEAVIEEGLNVPDLDGVTPLHLLFTIKKLEIIKLLLASEKVTSHGLSILDAEEITPAGYARKSNILEIQEAIETSNKVCDKSKKMGENSPKG